MSTQQKAELDKEKRKEEKKEAKRAKRQHYRELNEPPKLTVLEEVGNAVIHGIGAGLIQHCCCEEWCREQNLEFDAVNDNLPEIIEFYGHNSRKISCDYYIDDRMLLPENAKA